MNPCPPRSDLEAMLEDKLAREPEQALFAHVEKCPSCQQVLEELATQEEWPVAAETIGPGQPPELASTKSWDPRPADNGTPSPELTEDQLLRLRGLLLPPTETRDADFTGEEPAGFPQVPGYEILGELGRGGMGVVYQARHLPLDRLVALKMILAGEDAGPDHRARFLAEARAVARLRHPNIVQIYEVGEHGGQAFFSLELVEGPSLARKLTGKPWSAREAAELVATLAEAVQHAHDQGVLHRDLKPGNILLSEQGVPKVTDFGLAKVLGGAEALTLSGAVLGTPAYMAPEQASGQGDLIGPATDVFGLGAILYQLLTGRPPYQGNSQLEILVQAGTGAAAPPRQHNPQVPAALDRICRRALEPSLARRYATAGELGADLRRFLDRPRRRRVFLAGGVALLAAAAGVAFLFLSPDPEKGKALPTEKKEILQVDPNEKKPVLKDDRLILRIWSKDGTRNGRQVGVDPGTLPAQAGDKLRFEVRLNRPAYIYLLMLDAQGEVTPLYPWHRNTLILDKTLEDLPPVVALQSELVWPSRESKGFMNLDDNGGLETILLLARKEPIRDPKLLKQLIGRLPLPPTPLGEEDEFAVRGGTGGGGEEVIRFDHHRGIQKRLEQMDEPLEQLLGRLGKEFELLRAVRFAHKGR